MSGPFRTGTVKDRRAPRQAEVRDLRRVSSIVLAAAVVLAGAAALAVPPASVAGALSAEIGPGPPLPSLAPTAGIDRVADGDEEDPGWATLTFTTDGGEVRLGVSRADASGPDHWGMLLYEDERTVRAGWSSTSSPSGHRLLLNATTGGRSLHVEQRPDPPQAGLPVHVGVAVFLHEDLAAGTYHALYWAAGDVTSWGWSLSASDDVEVTVDGQANGTEAYLFTSEDFRGTATANVHVAGQGVRANADTHRSLEIEDSFIGTFSQFDGSRDRLSATAPDGTDTECPCSWHAFEGEGSAGPGDHVFHADGHGAGWSTPAGFGQDGEFYLGGVDARLPD